MGSSQKAEWDIVNLCVDITYKQVYLTVVKLGGKIISWSFCFTLTRAIYFTIHFTFHYIFICDNPYIHRLKINPACQRQSRIPYHIIGLSPFVHVLLRYRSIITTAITIIPIIIITNIMKNAFTKIKRNMPGNEPRRLLHVSALFQCEHQQIIL